MDGSPQSPALHIHLLGDFRLVYDSTPVTSADTVRLQSLLAYLGLHCNAPQSRHHLAFLFWPDSTEAQARTNLRNLLHLLRHALPDADRFLHIGRQTLQWRFGLRRCAGGSTLRERWSTRASDPVLSASGRGGAQDICQREGNSILPAGFGAA